MLYLDFSSCPLFSVAHFYTHCKTPLFFYTLFSMCGWVVRMDGHLVWSKESISVHACACHHDSIAPSKCALYVYPCLVFDWWPCPFLLSSVSKCFALGPLSQKVLFPMTLCRLTRSKFSLCFSLPLSLSLGSILDWHDKSPSTLKAGPTSTTCWKR